LAIDIRNDLRQHQDEDDIPGIDQWAFGDHSHDEYG
jgi:hypothetical protein